MATPHKCPVCDGSGSVIKCESYFPEHDTGVWYYYNTASKPCTACEGTGVLWEGACNKLYIEDDGNPSFPGTECPETMLEVKKTEPPHLDRAIIGKWLVTETAEGNLNIKVYEGGL